MDPTSLIVDIVILFVVIAIVVAIVRALGAQQSRARLTTLAPEARSRYVAAWERIEKRFLDAPVEAVQEADSLLLAMLGERGHPLGVDRLPRRMRVARRKMAEGERRHRTDDLRKALLDYRALFGEMIGPGDRGTSTDVRRETA